MERFNFGVGNVEVTSSILVSSLTANPRKIKGLRYFFALEKIVFQGLKKGLV